MAPTASQASVTWERSVEVRMQARKKCKGPGYFTVCILCKHEHDLEQGLVFQTSGAGRKLELSVNLNLQFMLGNR